MSRHVRIAVGDQRLEGDLVVPPLARGVVVFAHGSGSSRKSPRNQFVARELQDRGLATLLFDLLTPEEEREDRDGRSDETDGGVDGQHRFDVNLLAGRLTAATDFVGAEPELAGMGVGYFGASTGAAAALVAAANRPRQIAAVVSRGGRPDLAAPYLGRVRAPTLLIVGEADDIVLALNRRACDRLTAQRQLAVVAQASHLFEEAGALEEVARLAGGWFSRHLGSEPRGLDLS
jgi:putative phosphoribosyl transferase